MIDAAGQVEQQSYDAADELATATVGTNTPTTFSYNGDGDRTGSLDPHGVQSTYAWDQADQLIGYAKGGRMSRSSWNFDGDPRLTIRR